MTLQVGDDGSGVPDEVLTQLTRHWVSVDDTLSDDVIGLALSETVTHARRSTLMFCNLSEDFRVTIHLPVHVGRNQRAWPA